MTDYMLQFGLEVLNNGFTPLPITPSAKKPSIESWQSKEIDAALVDQWRSNGRASHGVGIRTGEIAGVDIDVRDREISLKLVSWCEKFVGKNLARVGVKPKVLLVYRHKEIISKQYSIKYESPDGNTHQIEILGKGQQFVCFGIHPDTNKPYVWREDKHPGNTPVVELVEITRQQIKELFAYFNSIVPKDWAPVKESGGGNLVSGDGFENYKPPLGLQRERIEKALALIDSDDRNDWIRVGQALHHEYQGGDEGLDIWDEWSQGSSKYPGRDDLEYRYRGFNPWGMAGTITMASVVRMAKIEKQKAMRRSIQQQQRRSAEAVKRDLDKNDNGKIYLSIANATKIVAEDDYLDLVGFNELTRQKTFNDRAITDADVAKLRFHIITAYGLEFTMNKMYEAIDVVAYHNPYHPVVDYLEGLQWDGVERVRHFFRDFAGSKEDVYIQEVGRLLFLGMVARSYEPGTKFDYMPILEGPQNKGKSMLVGALCAAPEWFTDTEFHIGTKDAMEKIQGKLVVEIGELAGMSKADVRSLKSFITSTVDSFRAAYARNVEAVPRTGVLVGTTNDSEYLRDETGARRFLPVSVGDVDVPGFLLVRDQLFAEAVELYKSGSDLFMTGEALVMAKSEQDARYVSDEWEELIAPFVEDKDKLTGIEILTEVFGFTPSEIDRAKSMRIAAVMKRLGWVRKPYRLDDGKLVKGFRKS